MRSILTISLLLFLGFLSMGQSVQKSGYASVSGSVYALQTDQPWLLGVEHNQVVFYNWKGNDWNGAFDLSSVELGLVDGSIEYTGSCSDANALFVLIKGMDDQLGLIMHYVVEVKNDAIRIERVSTSDLIEEVSGLIVFNGKLLVTGVFRSGLVIYNLLERQADGSWKTKGNALTRSLVSDFIRDVWSYKNKLYACGRFSAFGKVFHLAVLEDDLWKALDYPPFIDAAERFGSWNDKMVLFGRDRGHNDYIQYFDGIQWTGMSSGLTDYEIETIDRFASDKDALYAVGSFKKGTEHWSVMFYNGIVWKPLLNSSVKVSDITATNLGFLLSLEHEYISGYRFRKRMWIKNETPLFYTGLYLDVNGNCSFNPESDVVFTLGSERLNDGGISFIPDEDGEFAIPVSEESINLTSTFSPLYQMACGTSSSRLINTKDQLFLPKQGLAVQSHKPQIDLKLRPALSWSIEPGADALYYLCVRNTGSAELVSAELVLRFSERFEGFVPVDPVFAFNDTSATWLIESLGVMEDRCFRFKLTAPADLNLDEVLTVEAALKSPELDWQQDNGNKDKTVLSQRSVPQGPAYKLAALDPFVPYKPDFIDYKIVARNISRRTIQSISITDTLDAQLRIGIGGISFITSHPAKIHPSYFIDKDGNYRYILRWTMEKMNLPDSVQSPSDHSAFVDFRVNLADPAEHWGVCNKATIYYEFLEPVFTNEACNAFKDKLTAGNREELNLSSGLRMYPNPSNGKLNYNNANGMDYVLRIMDGLGREMKQINIPASSIGEVELNLITGSYYILDQNGAVQRLMIVH